MKDGIQSFLEDLQIRNYSPRTIADYSFHLAHWSRFLDLKKIANLSGITTTTVAEFQHWLYYQPTRRGTVRGVLNQNTILAAIKSYFRYLKNEGLIALDPAAALDYARQPKSLPRNVLTIQEARQILETVDATTLLGKRDKAILEVFYATGIRREESRNLEMADLDLDSGLLRINAGKGARDRVVPLGTKAVTALRCYLTEARSRLLGASQTNRLFISYRGNPLDPHTLERLSKSTPKRHKSKRSSLLTSGATPARPTWSRTMPTCAMCRTCSAIALWPPPNATCASPSPT